MANHQKNWSQSEKIEVLNYYKGHGMVKASKEFNVSSATIYRWINLFKAKE